MHNFKSLGSIKITKTSRKLIKNLFNTFVLSSISLTLYESIKQILIPRLTIWQSHTITIITGTIISIVSASIVYKNQQKLIYEK